jgi:transposase-like protein
VTHETIRDWEFRFAPRFADRLRAERRGRAGVSWYIDETYVKGAGRWCDLYRAIAREGMLIDSMLSAHRDKHAARRFLRGLLQVAERKPLRITTDAHPAYRRAAVLARSRRRRLALRRGLPPRLCLGVGAVAGERGRVDAGRVVRDAAAFFGMIEDCQFEPGLPLSAE